MRMRSSPSPEVPRSDARACQRWRSTPGSPRLPALRLQTTRCHNLMAVSVTLSEAPFTGIIRDSDKHLCGVKQFKV